MRSSRPTFPNASCAAATSMKTIEPDAARAAPAGRSTAATRNVRSTEFVTRTNGDPRSDRAATRRLR